MTAYEFHGDYRHGNPNTIHRTPKVAEIRYKMTMERENILNLLGIKVISQWGDEWKYEMNNFPNEYSDSLIADALKYTFQYNEIYNIRILFY